MALAALSLGSWHQSTPVHSASTFDLAIYLSHSPEPDPYPGVAVFTVTLQLNGDSQLATTAGDALGVRVLFPPSWNIDNDTGSDAHMTCSLDPSANKSGPGMAVADLCGTWNGAGKDTATIAKCGSVSFTISAHPNDPSAWGGGGSHAAEAQVQDSLGENANPTVQVADGVYVTPNSTVTQTPGPRNVPGAPAPNPPTGCTGGVTSATPTAATTATPTAATTPTPTAGSTPTPTPTDTSTPTVSPTDTSTPGSTPGSTPSTGGNSTPGASPTGGNQPAQLAQTGGGFLPPGGPIGALLGVLMIGAVAALATGKVRRQS